MFDPTLYSCLLCRQISILIGVEDSSNHVLCKLGSVWETSFAKYPPKIQRLKFVCTCPTTCPSRTTRTLNSACWRRTINIQSVFIQRKDIKISILGDHFMGSSHCDHQQQSWSRWHWDSGKNGSLDFLFTLIAG